MNSITVDFLRKYAELHPEAARRLKWNPPSLFWKGRWRRVRKVRAVPSGLRLELARGVEVPLVCSGELARRRGRFRVRFLKAFRATFPHVRLLRVLDATDRRNHQSAAFLRLLIESGTGIRALLIAYPGDACRDRSDRLLTSALLWWERLRKRMSILEIVFFLPPDSSQRLLRQLPHLDVPVRCLRYSLELMQAGTPAASWLSQIYPRRISHSEINSPYVVFPFQRRAPEPLQRLNALFPELDLCYRARHWELSMRGLRVAWLDARQGLRLLKSPREPADLQAFGRLVDEVSHFRSFPPPDPGHPYYRRAQEGWLESLVLKHMQDIRADLSGPVFAQVPTCIDGERKVLDLLTCTGEGRLVVLELKVEKNLDLVFQGLEYWQRVGAHLKRRDFRKKGFFSGVDLRDEPPLLLLVCPLFEFHPVLPVLGRHLSRGARFECIGLNADWKRELRILRRFTF